MERSCPALIAGLRRTLTSATLALGCLLSTHTVVRGEERVLATKWCAYTAAADGKPVTLALFDYPDNPRHPAAMFTMAEPFAYLAATLNLWKQPMQVAAGKPLQLRYGVALWDGEAQREEIERAYRAWIDWEGQ